MKSEKEVLNHFEKFLCNFPLEKYRDELRSIKTVEQDLPNTLNPLPAIYQSYWDVAGFDFPTFEDFFNKWWKEHLDPLDDFIKQYFWGCSIEFIQMGFKARIYRTLISLLTQFQFAYSWRANCKLPLDSSAEMDMNGLDALVKYKDKSIGIQMKKETYRREARGPGRFLREIKPNVILEVPYTITHYKEWAKG